MNKRELITKQVRLMLGIDNINELEHYRGIIPDNKIEQQYEIRNLLKNYFKDDDNDDFNKSVLQLIESSITLSEYEHGIDYTIEQVCHKFMKLILMTDPENKLSPFNKPYNN